MADLTTGRVAPAPAPASAPATPPAASAAAVRRFGRLQLLRLLGKSSHSMAWWVSDGRDGQARVLVLPRAQPADPLALQAWREGMRLASRVDHPHLAAPLETGVHDGWPFALYDPTGATLLSDEVGREGLPGTEVAALAMQLLGALAFAHDAGVVHHDVQPHLVLMAGSGAPRLMGLGVVLIHEPVTADATVDDTLDPERRRARRRAAERDVLAVGILMHRLVVGSDGEVGGDIAAWASRLPPQGRESLRLPWSLPQPLADPLRAIVNRATDRQPRQRYRNARTLQRALEGWLQTEAGAAGPLALLDEKLRTAGLLPAAPRAAERVARLALMERQRTAELAELVLEDLALAFELLRTVNIAQSRQAPPGSAPVLTVRRAIAMLGLDGVRRAALPLREWPGPLNEAHAAALERAMAACRHAGHLAIALRPAGYDAEVVYLITLLQGLAGLIVQYHFPDEAEQIRRLMQPAPPAREGEREEPGMSHAAAACAVLGADLEAIAQAVLRTWGIPDTTLTMLRRLPLSTPVRSAVGDDALLRAVASCAHEAVQALLLPAPRVNAALEHVALRYSRVLGLGPREWLDAVRRKPERISQTTRAAPLDEAGP
jgi:non-specific serine/threonine protein kinase